MTTPNFPSNSKSTPPDEPRKIERVVTNEVRTRPKSVGKKLKEALFGGDSNSAIQYVIVEVLIPQAKDMILDAATQGFQRLIFGDDSARARRAGGRSSSYTSYNRYSARGNRPMGSSIREERSTVTRQTHELDELIFETRPDALAVLEDMYEVIENYNMVSVAQLYAMVGKPSHFTDQKWGWENLQGSDIRMVRGGGYLLHLPKTVALD